MTTMRNLTHKVTKLEHQRKAHICFEMVEEYWPGNECFGECDLAFRRNGETIARFPRKLSTAEWESKYSQPHPQ